VRESLERIFIENQFHRINSSVPIITLYIKYSGEYVSVIQLLDFGNHQPITGAEYNMYKANAVSYIRSQGHGNIRFLTIILTTRLDACRSFVLDDEAVWLIDTEIDRLYIYERQIADFCNLRGAIETLCLSESYRVADNYRSGVKVAKKNNFWRREFTIVNSLLVVLNIISFIYLSTKGSTLDIEFMLDHGVMYVPSILEGGEYYRLLTCMFLHFGYQHLIGNMVVLLFLSDNVERNVGWWKYIIIYFFSGLAGSMGSFVYAYYINQGIVSAGASGAIYGIIGALLWLVIRNKGKLEDMTIMRVIVLIAYALFSGFTSENIDMAAHICGLFGGFLMAIVLYRKERITNEN